MVFICLYLVKRFGFSRFAKLAQRTENDVGDHMAEELQKTKTFVLRLLAIYGGSLALSLLRQSTG